MSYIPQNLNGQATMANSSPVVIASNQSPIATKLSDLYGVTRFGEQLTAVRNSQMNFKPTWGLSSLRYASGTTGVGALITAVGGEFQLQTGTSVSSLVSIQTNQRGQYQSGSMGQSGVGVRVPVLPTGTAFCEWGYTDFINGYYCGVDATGPFVALVTGGVINKIPQSAWNIDKMDGTGVSGLTLSIINGVISQIDFTWYGYGDIEFSYLLLNPITNKIVKTVCHRLKVTGEVSVIDPNQPLTFRAGNGATSTSNISLYIGGHQFSTVDGNSDPQARKGAELITSYTTANTTNWQPLISFRKKAIFNGRDNSVRVRLDQVSVSADAEMVLRYTIGGITNNLSFVTPTDRTASETAVETKITTATALTTSSIGEVFEYDFLDSTKKGTTNVGNISINTQISLGASQEVILWVRRLSASGTAVVKMASVSWTEEW